MPEQFIGAVKDWWGFLAFIGTGVVAYVAGRERQRYRIDQIGRDVDLQGKRIAALELQGTAEAIQLAEISTSQKHILNMLAEIKSALSQKADK